ncbi:MAG: methyltransferase domain-containing protein [Rudaea sp.]
MTQAYSAGFARIYNLRWGGFVRTVGPRLLDYADANWPRNADLSVLDLCCGTGQLATLFLERGYRVVGLDLSEPMLGFARENNRAALEQGRAQFVRGDAADFDLPEKFGLVVSTFDALNHLPGPEALQNCFRCVRESLVPGGHFVFDLNTRSGLNRWNWINVEDVQDLVLITRGVYDRDAGRAYTRISGFSRREDGFYERFEQTAYNCAFDLSEVKRWLEEQGFENVRFAPGRDFSLPLAEPEEEPRVFIFADRPESD